MDALKDVTGGNTKIPQMDFLPAGRLAIVDQGQSLVAGYTDEVDAAVRTPSPLIVFGDHTRAVKFIDFPFAMGADGIKVLQVRDGFDPRFVYRYLQSRNIPNSGYSRHFKYLKEIEIPKPPLAEQRRMAAILDRADALHAKRRQVLAHLDSLAQSLFNEVIGSASCESRPLGEVANFFGGSSLPEGEPFAEQSGGTLLMKVSDMNSLGNEDEVTSTAVWTDLVTARSATVESGSVVFPKRGASIATNKKRIIRRRTALDPNLMGIQPHTSVLTSEYLLAWLRSFDLASITSGSTVPQLNKRDLEGVEIAVPNLVVQEVFRTKLERLKGHQVMSRESAAACDELFASLQGRAFRGEL